MRILDNFQKVRLNNLTVITGGDRDTPGGSHCYGDGQTTATWDSDCANSDGSYSYYGLEYQYYQNCE